MDAGNGPLPRQRIHPARKLRDCDARHSDRDSTFHSLRLPPQLEEAAKVRSGIILVTGGTGSGKSSTLAALIDSINSEYCYHVLTVEDPIEFLHKHKRSTVHQRELHSDAPNFTLALRAALRQAPRVIMVGEVRDHETLEILLEAAENGHIVLPA